MKKKGKYLSPKAFVRIKRRKIFLTVMSVLLVLLVLAGGGLFLYFKGKLNLLTQVKIENLNPAQADVDKLIGIIEEVPSSEQTDPQVSETTADTAPTETETTAPTETEPVETTEPDYSKTGKIINILLIGQDSRPGEDSKLADSIILCTLNRETKTVTLTSFLRDTLLKMPNYPGHTCGKNRINVNYALGYLWGNTGGAMWMLNNCIYNNFGAEIDGDIEVGFDAFSKVVDLVDGVDVELDADEAAYMMKYAYLWGKADEVYTAGVTHLNGGEALGYARMRHASNSDSDIRRTGRQRLLISLILDKCRSMNLLQLNNMLNEVLPMISTNIEPDMIATYALELLPMITDLKVESNQCPAEGTYHGEMVVIIPGEPASGVLIPDLQKNRELLTAITEADK